jgi:hypothetical protein
VRLYKGVQPAAVKCPIGMYRRPGSGITLSECEFCPRGVYGDSPGLISSDCTAKCPKGTYNDKLGATSFLDCKLCPAGVYGSSTGLTTRACTAPCPYGKYSLREGLQSLNDCEDCPANYRGPQGRRGNNPYYDFEGGRPCDRYVKGKTIDTGRDLNAAQTLNEFMASQRVAHNTINNNK